jgi:hypothetical protein
MHACVYARVVSTCECEDECVCVCAHVVCKYVCASMCESTEVHVQVSIHVSVHTDKMLCVGCNLDMVVTFALVLVIATLTAHHAPHSL